MTFALSELRPVHLNTKELNSFDGNTSCENKTEEKQHHLVFGGSTRICVQFRPDIPGFPSADPVE